jgi:hypothetical protein
MTPLRKLRIIVLSSRSCARVSPDQRPDEGTIVESAEHEKRRPGQRQRKGTAGNGSVTVINPSLADACGATTLRKKGLKREFDADRERQGTAC